MPSQIDTFRGYDLWSKAYEGFDNPLIAMTTVALAQWAPRLEGKRVVELGCGTGRNAGYLLSGGASSYVGVDGSTGMLEVARDHWPDPRVSWVLADLSKPLPLEPASFDLVFFSLVLEHFPSLDEVLARAAELLVPGGRFKAFELHASLQRAGARAHFKHEGEEYELPSHPHDAHAFASALSAASVEVVSTTDWYVTGEAVIRNPKLSRHSGRPVLLEVNGRKRG